MTLSEERICVFIRVSDALALQHSLVKIVQN